MDFSVLTDYLDSLIPRGIPGVDCEIYYKHQKVYRHTAGLRDMRAGEPVKEDSLYFLYSASKVMTCTAALQLFEQGKFLMSDALSDYLPEFKNMTVRRLSDSGNVELVPAQNPITIRQLFTMTAGLTYDWDSQYIREVRERTGGLCPTREIMKAIAKQPLNFEPGEHWNYSLCHDVIGGLIEVISGERFSDYMRKHIFEPLGMKNTCFHLPEQELYKIAPLYFYDDTQKAVKEQAKFNFYILGDDYDSGGAGIISCVDDYMLFAEALNMADERILCKRTIDLMRTNHLNAAQQADFNWVQNNGYGYGLGVRTMSDKTRGSLGPVGEFGWDGAAGSYVLIDPDNELTIFYAQQLLSTPQPFIHPRIRNIVYRCIPE